MDSMIQAQGGQERWDSMQEVVLRVSTGGPAFAAKGHSRALRDSEVRVATQGQRVVIRAYPSRGTQGVYDTAGVRLQADDRRVVTERSRAGEAFRDLRQLDRWDALDMLHFSGSSLWTYVSLPFVLSRRGYALRDLGPWTEEGQQWRRVAVTFPVGVQTHARDHVLFVDDEGLIRRHDYTVDAFGRWAQTAQYCDEYREVSGLRLATSRRMFPRRGDGTPLREIQLVFIDIADAETG
ncbi:MAG: hypothetical protein LC722_09010 [Actinobacteria bacterium]|nr:hypothetical protein [Actinomycetota bacterium]